MSSFWVHFPWHCSAGLRAEELIHDRAEQESDHTRFRGLSWPVRGEPSPPGYVTYCGT